MPVSIVNHESSFGQFLVDAVSRLRLGASSSTPGIYTLADADVQTYPATTSINHIDSIYNHLDDTHGFSFRWAMCFQPNGWIVVSGDHKLVAAWLNGPVSGDFYAKCTREEYFSLWSATRDFPSEASLFADLAPPRGSKNGSLNVVMAAAWPAYWEKWVSASATANAELASEVETEAWHFVCRLLSAQNASPATTGLSAEIVLLCSVWAIFWHSTLATGDSGDSFWRENNLPRTAMATGLWNSFLPCASAPITRDEVEDVQSAKSFSFEALPSAISLALLNQGDQGAVSNLALVYLARQPGGSFTGSVGSASYLFTGETVLLAAPESLRDAKLSLSLDERSLVVTPSSPQAGDEWETTTRALVAAMAGGMQAWWWTWINAWQTTPASLTSATPPIVILWAMRRLAAPTVSFTTVADLVPGWTSAMLLTAFASYSSPVTSTAQCAAIVVGLADASVCVSAVTASTWIALAAAANSDSNWCRTAGALLAHSSVLELAGESQNKANLTTLHLNVDPLERAAMTRAWRKACWPSNPIARSVTFATTSDVRADRCSTPVSADAARSAAVSFAQVFRDYGCSSLTKPELGLLACKHRQDWTPSGPVAALVVVSSCVQPEETRRSLGETIVRRGERDVPALKQTLAGVLAQAHAALTAAFAPREIYPTDPYDLFTRLRWPAKSGSFHEFIASLMETVNSGNVKDCVGRSISSSRSSSSSSSSPSRSRSRTRRSHSRCRKRSRSKKQQRSRSRSRQRSRSPRQRTLPVKKPPFNPTNRAQFRKPVTSQRGHPNQSPSFNRRADQTQRREPRFSPRAVGLNTQSDRASPRFERRDRPATALSRFRPDGTEKPIFVRKHEQGKAMPTGMRVTVNRRNQQTVRNSEKYEYRLPANYKPEDPSGEQVSLEELQRRSRLSSPTYAP